jgi:uncharacterized membrane protein
MKMMRLISLVTVLVIMLASLVVTVSAIADDSTSGNTTSATPTPTPSDTIILTTEYPKLEAIAAGSLTFNVNMSYKGTTDREFDFKTSVPSGWDLYIQPQYETGKKISSITIPSSYSGTSKQIAVVISAPTYPIPDPGDYKVLITAVSGNLSGSIELVSRITAKFALTATPKNTLYNTSANAGKNNIYSITLNNIGTATLSNITMTSTHPDGWEITFSPEKLETLKTGDTQNVDVSIKPASKTVAGDYMINLQVSGKEVSATAMDIRVTVKTPTIWGWVGIILIVVVVAGLFVIIMRFGRR